jgi:hypothetical protein
MPEKGSAPGRTSVCTVKAHKTWTRKQCTKKGEGSGNTKDKKSGVKLESTRSTNKSKAMGALLKACTKNEKREGEGPKKRKGKYQKK